MKYWYGRDSKDKIVRLAKIYTLREHHIRKNDIDPKVLELINVLHSLKHRTYIVGGAVRDLLSNKIPKDFDVVTDAHPYQIKSYFNRSQIVSRRFPIVLVLMSRNRHVEVTTFRSEVTHAPSPPPHGARTRSKKAPIHLDDALFGTIQQDVLRRDFTCNALYYCPYKQEVYDFANGVEHLAQKKLVSIRTRFKEDPVRLVRAIKYASKVHLCISFILKCQIYVYGPLLKGVSNSRIGDEFIKILISGVSKEIVRDLFRYKLMKYMLYNLYVWYAKSSQKIDALLENLQYVDGNVENRRVRIIGFEMLIKQFVLWVLSTHVQLAHAKHLTKREMFVLLKEIKTFLYPMTPPNAELYQAITSILQSAGRSFSHIQLTRSRAFSTRRKRR